MQWRSSHGKILSMSDVPWSPKSMLNSNKRFKEQCNDPERWVWGPRESKQPTRVHGVETVLCCSPTVHHRVQSGWPLIRRNQDGVVFRLPSYRMKSDVLPNHKPFESKRDDPFPWVRQFFWRNHGCALLGGTWNRQGCIARRSCRKHSLHSDRTTWQSIYSGMLSK
jgi:hypothetical protein